jgi:hypothetical protein
MPYSAYSDNRQSRMISLAPGELGMDPPDTGRSVHPCAPAGFPVGRSTEPPDPPPKTVAIV